MHLAVQKRSHRSAIMLLVIAGIVLARASANTETAGCAKRLVRCRMIIICQGVLFDMKRRGFLQLFGFAMAAPAALAKTPERIEHVGSAKGTWRGPPVQAQNLPRAAQPTYTFDGDTDTGWCYDEKGNMRIVVSGKFIK